MREDTETGSEQGEVTAMLRRWQQDEDAAAQSAVVEVVYDELRALARAYMHRERAGHTLQGTALVNEALLRLLGRPGSFQDRRHFFRAAAQAMRRILVDHARRTRAGTRIAPGDRLPLDAVSVPALAPRIDLLELDRALVRLGEVDPDLARVVELRCFVGLTIPEVAGVQGVSEATVSREWKHAKARLRRILG